MTSTELSRQFVLLIVLPFLTISCSGSSPGQGSGSITLSWQPPLENTDGTPLNDLSGYKIYYGSSDSMGYITIDNPGVTEYVVDGLNLYTTHYFSITAFNSENVESSSSKTVSRRADG